MLIQEITDDMLDRFVDQVYLLTGITINRSKKNMLLGRLRPRMKKVGIKTYEEYLTTLLTDADEKQQFINIVTTNETSFFRTERVWNYFKCDFLKSWIEKNSGKTLRVWSAASSTGEEAYSIAMSCEEFSSENDKVYYQITGTDLSTRALSTANAGVYEGRNYINFKNKHPDLCEKYFDFYSDHGIVKDQLQHNTKFMKYNLFTNPVSELYDFDIVFLRNVLIYFTKEDQKKVMDNVSRAMKKGAIIIIGESESLNAYIDDYEFIQPQIYEKKA